MSWAYCAPKSTTSTTEAGPAGCCVGSTGCTCSRYLAQLPGDPAVVLRAGRPVDRAHGDLRPGQLADQPQHGRRYELREVEQWADPARRPGHGGAPVQRADDHVGYLGGLDQAEPG